VKRARPALMLLLAPLTALAGCGLASASGSSLAPPGNRIAGRTLTIYTSVPLHGASAVAARAVVGGELRALARIGGRIGRYRIVLRTLDDSSVRSGRWDPGQTTLNARLARTDPTTIGYLGEFNSGASAISIPVLDRAGIPQISPTNTAVGLTSGSPAASPGEPEKYYPTGVRTFARVVPSDAVQAPVLVGLQQAEGCTRTFVLDDGDVDGADTASSFQLAAQGAGLRVVGVQSYDPLAGNYLALAGAVAKTAADCVLISADTENHATLVTSEGGLPASLDPRVLITAPAQPDAILGYEAMSLMLHSISRATRGGRDAAERSKVVQAIFSTRDRHSLLGTYSIDSNGDTSLRRYGVYWVVHGQLRLWKAVDG
jgi:branched-chain amino acid transport system substrate-binding protein